MFARLPLVPSSITSLIFVFSAAFLRGFLAGGGVYAASGSAHISGYTSLYGFCSPVGMINFVFSGYGCIIQSESGYFGETVHWDWFKDVESLVKAFVDFQTKKLKFFLLPTTCLVNFCVPSATLLKVHYVV